MIQELTATPELNKTYLGKVQRITDFGAFVEIMPGTDGLLHVSEIANHRVKDVRDELKEGEQVLVKVINIDPTGKIRLSQKALINEGADPAKAAAGGRACRPGRPAAPLKTRFPWHSAGPHAAAAALPSRNGERHVQTGRADVTLTQRRVRSLLGADGSGARGCRRDRSVAGVCAAGRRPAPRRSERAQIRVHARRASRSIRTTS